MSRREGFRTRRRLENLYNDNSDYSDDDNYDEDYYLDNYFRSDDDDDDYSLNQLKINYVVFQVIIYV